MLSNKPNRETDKRFTLSLFLASGQSESERGKAVGKKGQKASPDASESQMGVATHKHTHTQGHTHTHTQPHVAKAKERNRT